VQTFRVIRYFNVRRLISMVVSFSSIFVVNKMEWKPVITTILIVCCLFFGIPIKIKRQPNKTEVLFQSYIHKFNKSYSNDEEMYQNRYQVFKVSYVISNNLIELS